MKYLKPWLRFSDVKNNNFSNLALLFPLLPLFHYGIKELERITRDYLAPTPPV